MFSASSTLTNPPEYAVPNVSIGTPLAALNSATPLLLLLFANSATLGCGAVGRGDGVAADEARGSGEPDGRGAVVGATVGMLVGVAEAGAGSLGRDVGGPTPALSGKLRSLVGPTWLRRLRPHSLQREAKEPKVPACERASLRPRLAVERCGSDQSMDLRCREAMRATRTQGRKLRFACQQ